MTPVSAFGIGPETASWETAWQFRRFCLNAIIDTVTSLGYYRHAQPSHGNKVGEATSAVFQLGMLVREIISIWTEVTVYVCGLSPGVTWLHGDFYRLQPSRVVSADLVTRWERVVGLSRMCHATRHYTVPSGRHGQLKSTVALMHTDQCGLMMRNESIFRLVVRA